MSPLARVRGSGRSRRKPCLAPGADPPLRAQGIGRVPALDGIRGIAILWVFAFHANALLIGGLLGPPSGLGQSLAEKGLLGVQLFFVLSGFLLALPWMQAAADGLPAPATGPFFRRRTRRILPAYWLHLALLFGAVLPLLHGGYGLLATDIGRANLLLHPLLMQFAHPAASSSLGLNMALWSLTIEAQFYLLLPLLAPLFTGLRVLAALPAALVLSLAWKTYAPELFTDWVYLHTGPALLVFFDPVSGRPVPFPAESMSMFLVRQLPGEFLAFAFGMAAANLYCRAGRHGTGVTAGARRGLGLGALAFLVAAPWTLAQLDFQTILGGGHWRYLGMPVFLLGCALLVLAAALRAPVIGLVLGNWALAALGAISYSLYLWHEPVIRLVRVWTSAWDWTGPPTVQTGTALALAVIAAVSVATLSYALTERRWRSAGAPRSSKTPRCPNSAGGGAEQPKVPDLSAARPRIEARISPDGAIIGQRNS